MLSEKRFKTILEHLDSHGSSSIKELSLITGSSESTVRRDIATLENDGLVERIYGGAKTIEKSIETKEEDMLKKHNLHSEEKERIGRFAATLIQKNDFVFLDAGTTTEAIARYITEKDAVYMTNGLFTAQLLTGRGFNVHVVGGRIRPRTEAVVGEEAINQISNCNFSLGFFGTNGITLENGYTTPNIVEAAFKQKALEHTLRAYVVADPSKFGKVYPKTFGLFDQAEIITTKLPDLVYQRKTYIKEVDI